jgi:meiosis induction protein kinase IME2/SME1
MVVDPVQSPTPAHRVETYEALDKALRAVQDNLDSSSQTQALTPLNHQISPSSILKRHHSLPQQQARSVENLGGAARSTGPVSSRTRRAQAHGVRQYETPDEEDELLVEALTSTHKAMKRMDRSHDYPSQGNSVVPKDNRTPLRQSTSNLGLTNPYPTPSPSASGSAVLFGQNVRSTPAKPLESNKNSDNVEASYKWPTPPYEENEWAESAAASIWAAGNRF